MKNFEEGDFNQRQLRRMAGEIALFKSEEITLGDLIKRLKSLHAALESPSLDWSDEFISQWGALEVMRAVDLDRKERGADASHESSVDFRARVSPALEMLNRLVREKLSDG